MDALFEVIDLGLMLLRLSNKKQSKTVTFEFIQKHFFDK